MTTSSKQKFQKKCSSCLLDNIANRNVGKGLLKKHPTFERYRGSLLKVSTRVSIVVVVVGCHCRFVVIFMNTE